MFIELNFIFNSYIFNAKPNKLQHVRARSSPKIGPKVDKESKF